VLLGSVGFVLLIASANVANLLLCRSAARQKWPFQAAIGAGRRRGYRAILTESLLLAMLGLVGVLVGNAGLKILLAVSPPNIRAFTRRLLTVRYLPFIGNHFGQAFCLGWRLHGMRK
jgi:hypothetical protein